MIQNQQFFDEVKEISNGLVQNIEELLRVLGVEFEEGKNFYHGVCPIHKDSDNKLALNIYGPNARIPGYWKCNTHECHNQYPKTILGFIMAVRKVKFGEALGFARRFLKGKEVKKQVKPDFIVKDTVLPQYEQETIIPSEYYLKRGFSKEILEKYQVGLCMKKKSKMYLRSVVPIYDEYGEKIVGECGRSIFEKCDKCKMFHGNTECPKSSYANFYVKWKFNKGFTKNILYNYSNALTHSSKNGRIILVEGPSDVWKLEQHGIKNSVALFGKEITDAQIILLERAGVVETLTFLDNDEAGRIGCQHIAEKIGKVFNNKKVEYVGTKDIKDLDKGEILELIS